jgi:hypothetical protein
LACGSKEALEIGETVGTPLGDGLSLVPVREIVVVCRPRGLLLLLLPNLIHSSQRPSRWRERRRSGKKRMFCFVKINSRLKSATELKIDNGTKVRQRKLGINIAPGLVVVS